MVNFSEQYGAKYIRFVDDFIVVCKDKKDINDLWYNAKLFLEERLHITLHPDKVYIQDVKKGVKFVGSLIKPNRTYLANRSVGGFYSMLNTLDKVCCRVYLEMERGLDCRYILRELEHYVCSVNSYMGFLVHTASYHIRCNTLNNLTWFWGVCEVDQKSKVVKIKSKYKLVNYFKHGKNRKKQTRSSYIRSKNKKVLLH